MARTTSNTRFRIPVGQQALPFLVSLLFSFNLWGQVDDPILETEEVEVIKNFKASLEEAEKVFLEAREPEIEKSPITLNYQVPARLLGLQYPPPRIRPLAMKRDKLPDIYSTYAKVGYGIPTSPYAELAYHYNKKEKFNFGGGLKHHAANFSGRENQAFSYSNASIYGTSFLNQGFALEGNARFTADKVHLYGYNDQDTSFTRDQVARNIQTVEAGIRFFNGPATVGDINYEASANFYNLNESFGESGETGFDLDLAFTHYLDKKHPIHLRLLTDITSFQDTATQNLNNFYLQPDFAFHADKFILEVGANLVSHNDQFFIFPKIELSAIILGSRLAAVAGVKGDLQKNTLRNILAYNPFAASSFELRNTNYREFYAGVKGKMLKFEYEGQIGLKSTKNLALFLNAPTDTRQLDILYDTVSIFYLKGSIIANLINNVEAVFTLSNSVFDPRNEEKAWHLPALEGNASLTYSSPDEKFRFRGELYLANGVPYLNEEGVRDRLNPLYDVSLAFDYRISKNLGLFLQLNNLANNRRERWSGYPVYGLNVLGGITARF